MVVSNASPLIAFQQIGRLDLLRHLFGTITIPPSVVRETARTLGLRPDWLVERPLTRAMDDRLLASLDEGEGEAIALALELRADWLVLDDLPARRIAEGVGLPVVGSLGIVVRAKQRGLLPAAKPLVDALIANGLFVGSALYLDVLAIAEEAP